MTGDVTAKFNGITLFGIALFWQKAIEFFTNFIIHFLTYRVECLFNSKFYCLLVLQISFRLGGIWIVGSHVDAQPTDRWPSIADGCLIDFSGNVNSVNKSSRIKHYTRSQTERKTNSLLSSS